MRVVFIPDQGEKYGAAKSLMELVGTLKKNYDIEPIVLTCKKGLINEFCNKSDIENYVIGHGAFLIGGGTTIIRRLIKQILRPFLFLKYKYSNMRAFKLAEKFVDFNKIDLIHTNVNRNDIGALLAKKNSIPHIWHIREFGELDYNCFSLHRKYIQYMNNNATKFIAISNEVKNFWVKKGIQTDKTVVVYNGIDISKFEINEINKNKNNSNFLKIVFTGSISEAKGQKQLLEAIALIPDEIRKFVRVDIYGSGVQEYLFKLKNLVAHLNIQKNVNFLGYYANLPTKLPEYNIGIICSRSEGFGRATVEYMASRLCVIASDTGANPEIIDNEKTGLLYKYGDINDLSNKIQYLYKNQLIQNKLAKAGYEKAMASFTAELNAEKIYCIYKATVK